MGSRMLNLLLLLMLFVGALLLLSMCSGCTYIKVSKPDGTVIVGTSWFQDLAIGRMDFRRYPATAPSTQPTETFRLEGYDEKARLDTLNRVLDRIP